MAFEPPFEDEFFDVVCDAVLLQFDIEQASGSELVQNVGQQRDRAAESCVELAQGGVVQTSNVASPIRGAVNRVVMNDNQLPVRAPADVELQSRRAALQSFSE